MLYRRRVDDTVWHFCQNCSCWPDERCQEETVEPPRESLCAECTAKTKELACEVVPQPGIS